MELICRDALIEKIENYVTTVSYGSTADWAWARGKTQMKEQVLKDIRDAPTVGGWISVEDRLPEEHESIFHKFLGTPKWSSAMWQQESDKVLVCVSFPDGTSVVTTGCLHNSDWMTTVSKTLPQKVTHWMPLPEPPKMERGEDDAGNDRRF